MAILPLDQSIPRFQANEDRINVFVNGDAATNMQTSGGQAVPSIRKIVATKTSQIDTEIAALLGDRTAYVNSRIEQLIGEKDTLINQLADGVLAGAVAARNKAARWAAEDVDVPVEDDEYSARHYAAKSAEEREQVAEDLATFTALAESLTELGTPWDETVGAQQIKAGDAEAIRAKINTPSAEAVYTKEETFSREEIDERVTAGGVPIGASVIWNSATLPLGFIKENGAAVSRAAYPGLDAAIYVGDAANATAPFGYRCTDPADPNGSRSVAGTHIVVPDSRGEFVRGADDGRGVDPGRVLGSSQGDQNKSHTHTGSAQSAGAHTHTVEFDSGVTGGGSLTSATRTGGTRTTGSSGDHTHTLTIAASGGNETRPRNIAKYFIIRAY